ncbi:ankyrin repeat-containing domain protein [Cercophora samala]|uniref:Ankyrin repeat-containing domain protein n=1 Tax=Cercophora samala TaxID=330535 RepID=A0AA40DD12_9PEZI|nr:ankyrin repeat-containing domain protein [Cercophora samala]
MATFMSLPNETLVQICNELIERLVKGGAAHEWAFDNGRRAFALHLAARNFRRDAIVGLLEAGVDVNAADDKGHTALMVLLGNIRYTQQFPIQSTNPKRSFVYDNVQTFVDFGVEVNAQDRSGKTALHHFFRAFAEWPDRQWTAENAEEVLEFLLEEGANPLIRDSNGVTAFEVAVKCKHVWAINMMALMCKLDLKTSFGGLDTVQRLFSAAGCAHQYDRFSYDSVREDHFRDADHNEIMSSMTDLHMVMDLQLDSDLDNDFPTGLWDTEDRLKATETVSEAVVDALFDMDLSHHFTSSMPFFLWCLPPANQGRVRSSRQFIKLVVARVLCRRGGLSVSQLDSGGIKPLFKRLRRLQEWDMVCRLLDSVPDGEIDSLDGDGETLLFATLAHGDTTDWAWTFTARTAGVSL